MDDAKFEKFKKFVDNNPDDVASLATTVSSHDLRPYLNMKARQKAMDAYADQKEFERLP